MGFYYGREIYDAMIQGTIHTGDEAKVKQVYIENWKSDDSLWLNWYDIPKAFSFTGGFEPSLKGASWTILIILESKVHYF